MFPKLGPRGGNQISTFSQIQKSPNHPRGGGGGRKLWTFSTFLTFFNSIGPLSYCHKCRIKELLTNNKIMGWIKDRLWAVNVSCEFQSTDTSNTSVNSQVIQIYHLVCKQKIMIVTVTVTRLQFILILLETKHGKSIGKQDICNGHLVKGKGSWHSVH